MTSSHRKKLAAAGAGIALLLTGVLAGCSQEAPRPAPKSTSFSAPAPSTTQSTTPTDAGTGLGDAATAEWGSEVNVIPSSGPVKVAAPKSEEAALEVTYELAQRYGKLEQDLERAKKTGMKPVQEFVAGRLLAQLEADTKIFAKASWTFTGESKADRLGSLDGSYARTAQAKGKDGKTQKVPFGATWLRYCVDASDIKLVLGKDGKKPVMTSQDRRLFEAQALYNANTGRWFLIESRAVKGSVEETTC